MAVKNQQPPGDNTLCYDDYWHVNAGHEKIHAKRIRGRFRTYKWLAASLWLIYFIAPYSRWNGRQAILFDIPARKFHLFSITLWPQDIWILSLLLLFLALGLFAMTAVAGRIFCGYICFQTVWTDVFTFIENKLEGPPAERIKLDKAPWSFTKIRIKSLKHLIWLTIAALSGVTFTAYFADAFWLWRSYFTLQVPAAAWITLFIFVIGIYIFVGFMREQVCFWLCPYARIQGVMVDRDTILPTYDKERGDTTPENKAGDCIDCKLCGAVCPTGVDIRNGQLEGCITCGLCIDACDSVMDKTGRPGGLIRYASLRELEEGRPFPIVRRPRVVFYSLFLLALLTGIVYGLSHTAPIDLKVLHERQPLFVRLSDGSIQNKYSLKIVNKTDRDLLLNIAVSGPDGIILKGVANPVQVTADKVVPIPVYLRVSPESLDREITPITFTITSMDGREMKVVYESMFIAPN